jgi:hypothetical protein
MVLERGFDQRVLLISHLGLEAVHVSVVASCVLGVDFVVQVSC